MAQAHGTRYDLNGRPPFVAFDMFSKDERLQYGITMRFCRSHGLSHAPVLFKGIGEGCSIDKALELLGEYGKYGAIDVAEGCVWRWERPNGNHIAMAKYVRPEKEIGYYLKDEFGNPQEKWNILRGNYQ